MVIRVRIRYRSLRRKLDIDILMLEPEELHGTMAISHEILYPQFLLQTHVLVFERLASPADLLILIT